MGEIDKKEAVGGIDRREEIKLINERPVWMLDENRERWKKAIDDMTPRRRLGWLEGRKRGEWSEVRDGVLAKVVHASNANICDKGAEATLLAPSVLGKTHQSGKRDEEIGNTDYVFGCFLPLRSRSARTGKDLYVLNIGDESEAYVVPCDIADLSMPEELAALGDYEDVQLMLYRQNILRFDDFSELFVEYCKVVFENPEQVVGILSRNWFYSAQAVAWTSEGLTDREHGVVFLRKMANLYRQYGVVPPIAPEVQVKKSVSARRITDEESEQQMY